MCCGIRTGEQSCKMSRNKGLLQHLQSAEQNNEPIGGNSINVTDTASPDTKTGTLCSFCCPFVSKQKGSVIPHIAPGVGESLYEMPDT